MNPVERDIRGYFGIAPEDSILEHYGTKRHSGRYPWGSGENPYQRSGDFLSRVEELKKSGMKEKDILQTINDSLPEEYKMGATEFRMAQRRAIHERQQLKYDRARALSQDGLGPTEIGREMGLSESTVRSMLKNDKPDKYTRTKEIAETLRKEVDKKGMIDVSEGTNLVLGISEGDLDDAIFVLEAEHGYQRYGVGIRQPTNINQQTNITVLAKPEYDQKYAYQHQNEIQSLGEYHSEDGGETFKKLQRPSSMSSDRVCIRYGDEGGLDKDGVIEIRRGVADLNLGKSHYAQVRIMVDDSHYLKGMAVYSDDIPEGYDVVFNTNKKSGTPKMKVLKPIKDDPDNPFGASIKANGQSTYIGEDGKEHLSPIKSIIKARKEYKGSGSPTFYTTDDVLTDMLLLEDGIGHPLYADEAALARKLRVKEIVTVPRMEGRKGAKGGDLLGIVVNLADYTVGADKGGEVNMFDDFNIDYNQLIYLIETRCSGAMTTPYGAMAIEMDAANSSKV